jgi:hypothetical protein
VAATLWLRRHATIGGLARPTRPALREWLLEKAGSARLDDGSPEKYRRAQRCALAELSAQAVFHRARFPKLNRNP